MGTQGVISILGDDFEMKYKIIVGCNGYFYKKVIADIFKKKPNTIEQVYDICVEHSYGCTGCLTVLDKNKYLPLVEGEEISSSYRKTFENPYINPRWDRGTADCLVVLTNYNPEKQISLLNMDDIYYEEKDNILEGAIYVDYQDEFHNSDFKAIEEVCPVCKSPLKFALGKGDRMLKLKGFEEE